MTISTRLRTVFPAWLLGVCLTACKSEDDPQPEPEPEPHYYNVVLRLSATGLLPGMRPGLDLVDSRPDLNGNGFVLTSQANLPADSPENGVGLGYSGFAQFAELPSYIYYRETPRLLRTGMKRGQQVKLNLSLNIDPAQVRDPRYASTSLDLAVLADRAVVQRVQLRPSAMTPNPAGGYQVVVPVVLDADTF